MGSGFNRFEPSFKKKSIENMLHKHPDSLLEAYIDLRIGGGEQRWAEKSNRETFFYRTFRPLT